MYGKGMVKIKWRGQPKICLMKTKFPVRTPNLVYKIRCFEEYSLSIITYPNPKFVVHTGARKMSRPTMETTKIGFSRGH